MLTVVTEIARSMPASLGFAVSHCPGPSQARQIAVYTQFLGLLRPLAQDRRSGMLGERTEAEAINAIRPIQTTLHAFGHGRVASRNRRHCVPRPQVTSNRIAVSISRFQGRTRKAVDNPVRVRRVWLRPDLQTFKMRRKPWGQITRPTCVKLYGRETARVAPLGGTITRLTDYCTLGSAGPVTGGI